MSTNIRTLEARAYRDGKWWTFEIPELTSLSPLRGDAKIIAMGQARTVKEIAAAARDVAATWLEVDERDVEVTVTIELPEDVAALWADANKREASAREAVAEAARLRRDAVRVLTAAGVSQADTARALHLSPQRVSQLTR